MEPNLKTIAEYHGYRGDLPGFLLVLQENARLDGVGLGIVAKALEKHLPKDDVVKIALANQGNILPDDASDGEENGTSLEEWAQQGEAEFNEHCDDAGKFRFSDFRIEPPQSVDQAGTIGAQIRKMMLDLRQA